MKNLGRRSLTALFGAVPLLAALWYGGWVFGVVILAIALAAQYEVYRLFERGGTRPWIAAGLVIGALVGLRAFAPTALPFAVACSVALVAWCPLSSAERPLHALAATLLGAVYPTALLTYLTELRLSRGGGEEALMLTLGVLVLVWVSDIAAYVAGSLAGRHLLAPSVSPAKTWEGAVVGLAASMIVAVAAGPLVADFLGRVDVLVVAAVCGGVSQFGDLAESRFKREVGVKDSGAFLPGHGGFLDRFDGAVVAVPLVYLYLSLAVGG